MSYSRRQYPHSEATLSQNRMVKIYLRNSATGLLQRRWHRLPRNTPIQDLVALCEHANVCHMQYDRWSVPVNSNFELRDFVPSMLREAVFEFTPVATRSDAPVAAPAAARSNAPWRARMPAVPPPAPARDAPAVLNLNLNFDSESDSDSDSGSEPVVLCDKEPVAEESQPPQAEQEAAETGPQPQKSDDADAEAEASSHELHFRSRSTLWRRYLFYTCLFQHLRANQETTTNEILSWCNAAGGIFTPNQLVETRRLYVRRKLAVISLLDSRSENNGHSKIYKAHRQWDLRFPAKIAEAKKKYDRQFARSTFSKPAPSPQKRTLDSATTHCEKDGKPAARKKYRYTELTCQRMLALLNVVQQMGDAPEGNVSIPSLLKLMRHHAKDVCKTFVSQSSQYQHVSAALKKLARYGAITDDDSGSNKKTRLYRFEPDWKTSVANLRALYM